MRRITFRGKRIDNAQWIYGDLVRFFNQTYIFNFSYKSKKTNLWCKETDFFMGGIENVIPKTVGQIINNIGEKIMYENDIIEYGLQAGRKESSFAIVKYNEIIGGFILVKNGKHCGSICQVREIVGNIHDATEEQKKEWKLKW